MAFHNSSFVIFVFTKRISITNNYEKVIIGAVRSIDYCRM